MTGPSTASSVTRTEPASGSEFKTFTDGTNHYQAAVVVSQIAATIEAPANVASSATSGEILDANTARVHATIHNDADTVLHLRPGGGTATTSSGGYTYQLEPDDLLIIDQHDPMRQAQWTGIWQGSPTGGASVQECLDT